MLRFLYKARFQHFVHTQVNAAVKYRALWEIQTEDQAAVGPLRWERLRFLFAQLFASGTVMLECAQHPYLIVRVDSRSSFRVGLLQFFVHGSTAFCSQFRRQLLPQTGRCFFLCKAHPIQKALNIQPCAAHKDGQLLPGRDLFFQLSGHGGKVCHAESLVRCKDVHAVMRDTAGLLRCHLCRAYVQTFIDLHGITADDLAGKMFCKLYAQRRLSGCGRADDGHHGMFIRCVQTAFPAPSGSI